MFEEHAGKRLDIILDYCKWNEVFPLSRCNSIRQRGCVPELIWDPEDINLTNIISGNLDGYITKWTRQAKVFAWPLFVVPLHEMNGDWYSWCGYNNGATLEATEKFKKAWVHIIDIFHREGASNVAFVWAPNWEDWPKDDWNNFRNYYPGDEYVDWVGVDFYNYNGEHPEDMLHPIYDEYSNSKPIMICECAASNNYGDKAEWIKTLFLQLEYNFPKVRAFAWFNVNKERDWRIESSTDAQNAYRIGVASNYFVSSPTFIKGSPPSIPTGCYHGAYIEY